MSTTSTIIRAREGSTSRAVAAWMTSENRSPAADFGRDSRSSCRTRKSSPVSASMRKYPSSSPLRIENRTVEFKWTARWPRIGGTIGTSWLMDSFCFANKNSRKQKQNVNQSKKTRHRDPPRRLTRCLGGGWNAYLERKVLPNGASVAGAGKQIGRLLLGVFCHAQIRLYQQPKENSS